jgi:hypothetical protein
MSQKHKQALLILSVFLLIESIYQLLELGLTGVLYTAIGFNDYRYSFMGVLGCLPPEHRPLIDCFFITYRFCIVIAAFLLAKFSNQTFYRLLLSAVCIYHFGSGTLNHIAFALLNNKIPFVPYLQIGKMDATQILFWGNDTHYKIGLLVLYYIQLAFSIYVTYQLTFVLWPKWFSKQLFLYGIVASAAGILLWYLFIGPWLLPFPKF